LLRLVRGIRVRGLPSGYRAVWPILPFLETGDDLLRSPELAGLSALDLEGNELGDAGVESLLFLLRRGEVGIQLLNLRSNYLTPRGAQELATSPVVAALRDLDLGINILGPAGAVVLARSAYLGRLHVLKLDDCRLGTAGVRALVDSPLLGQLTTLDLGSNGLGDPGVVALAETSAVRGLTTLTLNNNGIGDVGADALLRSANFDGVKALRLLNNWSISTELRLALRERFGDRVRL
jgi:Ran GTPase-activating protein (RanGAP) involved in mRNA processing and transport